MKRPAENRLWQRTSIRRAAGTWLPALLGAVLAAAPLSAAAAGFVRWTAVNKGLNLGAEGGVREVSLGGAPPVAYVIVEGAGLYRSKDLGETWTLLRGDAAPLKEPYAVTASPADGNVAFAAGRQAASGLWRTGDGGGTWTKVGAQAGLASEDVEWIAMPAGQPELILVGHREGGAISVSRDGGKSWRASQLGAEVKRQLPIVVDKDQWVVASRAQSGIRYTTDGGKTWAAGEGRADYFPGPLPVVQTGRYLFASSHHGTNKSADGGQTWTYVMERHARVIGTLDTLIFREDRGEIRGEPARQLTINISGDYANSWEDVTGALLDQVPADLRQHVTIQNSVDPFAHVRMATAWAAAPAQRTVLLGLGKAGLYRGVLLQTKRAPYLVGPAVRPFSLPEGDTATPLTVRVMASPRAGNLRRVSADLRAVGRGDLELLDDGKHDDGQAEDRVYANTFTLPEGIPAGDKSIGIVAEDDAGHVASIELKLKIASSTESLIVWDGDKFAHGQSWCGPTGGFNFIKPQTEEAHGGKVALEFHGDVTGGWVGGGWNWHGWYPANAGNDIRGYRNLCFWAMVDGDKKRSFTVALQCSTYKSSTAVLDASEYVVPEGADLLDGKWHEVVIPLADLYGKKDMQFDPTRAWQLELSTWGPQPARFSVYLDDIGFDNRRVRPHSQWTTLPEGRTPAALGQNAARVTAEIDVKSEGRPISPFIYGAAMGDRKAAQEMGLTMLRAGGNPVTPFNWKTGFGAKGADWFYQNEGTETPPERTWLATFHGENRKAGLESYLTIPIMGRVAKDGVSVAFDTRKYPDQENWAGRAQPTDRLPHAGSGRQYVKGDDGQLLRDKKGQPVLRDIEANPDATSVEMPPEEQAAFLKFMIEKMGYGAADKGGIRCVALDNEPCLWHATHRGMYPKACSYDELWERTRTYAGLLKKIDPKVKIAGGNFWGWTAYFYSGLDSQLVSQGKGTWQDPPDFVAHGRVPITKWLLGKLAAHEKETGQRLVDIFDFHFYPQTGIYMGGAVNDPAVMEGRVQETRALWDPTWKDPSWMGTETGKVLQVIRLMRKWADESCPGLQLSLGEYNFGGERDASGGVAQAELLGVFAREGLDYAFFWFAPAPNSSPYFAYKMFRNPDGKQTAFGDRYLPAKVSAPDDVSVHAARDSQTGRLTFVLVNKRAAKGARVELRLNRPAPAQKMIVYEYGLANRHCIGQWPAQAVQGDRLPIDLPPMSVLRFDLTVPNAK
jgi:hypothetical protein